LAEDLGDSVAAFSDRRIRVDHYRGLPPEASVVTRHHVEEQIGEKKSLAQKKREEAIREHEESMKIAAHAARIERAAAAAKEQAKREALAILEKQVAEAAEKKKIEQMQRRGISIDDDFYKGFGKSDR
jgi:flagellar biosynthesis GTPase FlhF